MAGNPCRQCQVLGSVVLQQGWPPHWFPEVSCQLHLSKAGLCSSLDCHLRLPLLGQAFIDQQGLKRCSHRPRPVL